MGVIVHHSWGVTEIKACIMEAREAEKNADPTERMKRISHMNMPELWAKANELGIDYASTTTKGNLLRLIRDSLNNPDQELMKIGKFKGYQFCEIPQSYGEWTVRELAQADNPDPELVRFGRWFNNKQKNKETKGYLKSRWRRLTRALRRPSVDRPPHRRPPRQRTPGAC